MMVVARWGGQSRFRWTCVTLNTPNAAWRSPPWRDPPAIFCWPSAAVGGSALIYRFAPLNHASLLGLCVLSNLALLGTGMGLFNLIPISPLDGSKILFALLPDRIYHTILRYERYVMIVMILLVVSGVFDTPLSFLMTHVLQLFCSATGMSLDWLLVSRNASVILNLL